MSIGCLSSESEGFSNAILEYMATGLPVVATDVGGTPELVVDERDGTFRRALTEQHAPLQAVGHGEQQNGLQVGVDKVAQTAQKLGIETPLETSGAKYSIQGGPFQPYNPALVLGGLETGVTPLEMATAYATLANDGEYHEPYYIDRIEDREAILAAVRSTLDREAEFARPPAWRLSGWTNQRVAAKGFLTKTASDERITVSSLRVLGSTCTD